MLNNKPLDTIGIPSLWHIGDTVTNRPNFNESYLSKLIGDNTFDSLFNFDYDSNTFIAYVDLPGCRKDNITIELDIASNKIVINSFRTIHNSTVKVNKTLMFPKDGDVGKLKAYLDDGVLTLKVPKTIPQTTKFTKITIE